VAPLAVKLWQRLGHNTLAEAARYTREADRRRGGREASAKLEAHKANRIAQTTLIGLVKNEKSEGKSK
jgi:hypothetical protein